MPIQFANAKEVPRTKQRPFPFATSEPIGYVQDEEEQRTPGTNCVITIRSERKSGVKDVENLYTSAKSKAECANKSKVHRINYFPDQIKTKKVSIRYQEKIK